jgi:hypothetical protein
MEKIIRDAILKHLKDNDLISDNQHGFVKGRSCTTQLLEVLDIWTDILDQGDCIDAIYLDFQKAFDMVPHKRLISKLKFYGIDGNILKWLESFLTNRRQRVIVAGEKSECVM